MLTKQELRQLQEKEIQEELAKSSRELIKAKVEHSSQTLKETHKIKSLKKHIAVINTVMNESANEPSKEVKEPKTKKEVKTAATAKPKAKKQ